MATTAQRQAARTRPLTRAVQDGRSTSTRRRGVGTAAEIRATMAALGKSAPLPPRSIKRSR